MKILHMVKGMQTIICDHYKSIHCGSPSQMQIVKSIKTYMSLCKVFCNDGNLREEPKFVVFLSQMLELFRVCATCRSPDMLV